MQRETKEIDRQELKSVRRKKAKCLYKVEGERKNNKLCGNQENKRYIILAQRADIANHVVISRSKQNEGGQILNANHTSSLLRRAKILREMEFEFHSFFSATGGSGGPVFLRKSANALVSVCLLDIAGGPAPGPPFRSMPTFAA